MLLSPSKLVLDALSLDPAGALINEESHPLGCAICGVEIAQGDRYDRLDLPPSFTNHLAIAEPGGAHICSACKAVMGQSAFQMKLATGLFSRDGFFPLMRKEHRAWAFLTPPEPPFIIALQTAKQQHVVWRAPVTLSRELLLVRVGEQILRLRRPRLIAARAAVERLHEARKAASEEGGGNARKNKTKAKPSAASDAAFESPFVADWKFQSADGGVMKKWADELIRSEAIRLEDRDALCSLNAAEAWALQAVLHRAPVRPDPICSIDAL